MWMSDEENDILLHIGIKEDEDSSSAAPEMHQARGAYYNGDKILILQRVRPDKKPDGLDRVFMPPVWTISAYFYNTIDYCVIFMIRSSDVSEYDQTKML